MIFSMLSVSYLVEYGFLVFTNTSLILLQVGLVLPVMLSGYFLFTTALSHPITLHLKLISYQVAPSGYIP